MANPFGIPPLMLPGFQMPRPGGIFNTPEMQYPGAPQFGPGGYDPDETAYQQIFGNVPPSPDSVPQSPGVSPGGSPFASSMMSMMPEYQSLIPEDYDERTQAMVDAATRGNRARAFMGMGASLLGNIGQPATGMGKAAEFMSQMRSPEEIRSGILQERLKNKAALAAVDARSMAVRGSAMGSGHMMDSHRFNMSMALTEGMPDVVRSYLTGLADDPPQWSAAMERIFSNLLVTGKERYIQMGNTLIDLTAGKMIDFSGQMGMTRASRAAITGQLMEAVSKMDPEFAWKLIGDENNWQKFLSIASGIIESSGQPSALQGISRPNVIDFPKMSTSLAGAREVTPEEFSAAGEAAASGDQVPSPTSPEAGMDIAGMKEEIRKSILQSGKEAVRASIEKAIAEENPLMMERGGPEVFKRIFEELSGEPWGEASEAAAVTPGGPAARIQAERESPILSGLEQLQPTSVTAPEGPVARIQGGLGQPPLPEDMISTEPDPLATLNIGGRLGIPGGEISVPKFMPSIGPGGLAAGATPVPPAQPVAAPPPPAPPVPGQAPAGPFPTSFSGQPGIGTPAPPSSFLEGIHARGGGGGGMWPSEYSPEQITGAMEQHGDMRAFSDEAIVQLLQQVGPENVSIQNGVIMRKMGKYWIAVPGATQEHYLAAFGG
jgi:hypothetical protein